MKDGDYITKRGSAEDVHYMWHRIKGERSNYTSLISENNTGRVSVKIVQREEVIYTGPIKDKFDALLILRRLKNEKT